MTRLERAALRLQDVLTSTRSSFYRDVYASRGYTPTPILTQADWNKVPVVSKMDFLPVRIESRTYIDQKDVHYTRYSSGTSGTGVLALPLQFPKPNLRINDSKNVLSFRHRPNEINTGDVKGVRIVYAEDGNLPASAALAHLINADTLDGSASKLIAFAPYLRDDAFRAGIKWLWVHAERCTLIQLETLKKIYPNAQYVYTFAFIEGQHILAFSPDTPIPGHPLAVTERDTNFFEIINEKGECLTEPGAEGEIALTVLYEGQASPLIRYRPGDRGRVVSLEDDRLTFEILERTFSERIRMNGGEIFVSELERVIQIIRSEGIIDFEGTVTELVVEGKPRAALKLKLYYDTLPHLTAATLSDRIASNLRVNQVRTYADGVAHQLFMPLECTLAHAEANLNMKRVRLRDLRQ